MEKQKKNKRVTLRMTEFEYAMLQELKSEHKKVISDLITDAIIFYSIYFKQEN